MKTFMQMLSEVPLPPPTGGGMPPMGAPMGGGMPPMPPPPMGGGGMGGLPPPPMGGGDPMGGGGGNLQPVPVKTIDAMDVWEVIKKASKDMEKHEELNINYERKKKKKPENFKKNSALMT